jgi:hypothetical protein
MKHSDVKDVLFEPHDLWAAVDLSHFKRLMTDGNNMFWATKKINLFKNHSDKWVGAKFALNPGTKALEWKWLHKTFPGSKFIFIVRDVSKTWRSAFKQDKDSVRGIIHEQAYRIMADELIKEFRTYQSKNVMDACIISAEKLIDNPDEEMKKAWAILGVPPLTGLRMHMKIPENG